MNDILKLKLTADLKNIKRKAETIIFKNDAYVDNVRSILLSSEQALKELE